MPKEVKVTHATKEIFYFKLGGQGETSEQRNKFVDMSKLNLTQHEINN